MVPTIRTTSAPTQKPKKVVIHPEFHRLFAHEAIDKETSIQELVHEALCKATDRLDLWMRSPEES